MTGAILLDRPALRLALVPICYLALQASFGNRLAAIFTLALIATTLRPHLRGSILSSLAVVVCLYNNSPSWRGDPEVNRIAVWGLIAGGLWIGGLLLWTKLYPSLPAALARRSLIWLHLNCAAAVGLLFAAGRNGWMSTAAAGALCTLIPELLWRSSYWIKWRERQGGAAPVWRNLFPLLPFIGGGGVPIGKGPAYFAKHEASTPKALAAAEFEGAKLLLLSLAWRWTDGALGAVLWTAHPAWQLPGAILPTMQELLTTPAAFTLFEVWAGLFAELAHAILTLAAFGHVVVGVLCLAGFRIPRNTDAPLLATTILDFWNRYYFYFKEVLIDFFFFPVFLRTGTANVRWRTWISVIAAAFFGNVYYHALLYSRALASSEPAVFLKLLEARLVYCGLLASALCWSFAGSLRRGGKAPALSLPMRLARMGGVALFFALIHVWNFGEADIPLENRLDLWKRLIGLG